MPVFVVPEDASTLFLYAATLEPNDSENVSVTDVVVYGNVVPAAGEVTLL